ncbi:Rha family transcriptional regulator [Clostridium saccharoperbutylacetonicum]|uniref:Rha family transcriptional regulator n=1 Tax=Clostridium saccharoperbutylacetonicum TaxID=36745 RepID=UPI000983BB15|nr:Rha family transcriptional regulator [Clostridium saccharoperbutylacetonicum]AQR93399.1 phage regulatory protein Rha (phage_pRha) [Clostridium saccharoperbutylacetonicum]NSB29096.1 Rha family phage regulatory protein [Clostridium saccharoperbutylacetonicum]
MGDLNNNPLTIDSREVADMTGKRHDHLIRDIKGYIKVLDDSPTLGTPNFFVESTYINSQNKEQPCYLLTRKGCDMVANKMTGEKGILFTATYVTKFEEMEQQMNKDIKLEDISLHVKRN